MLTYECGMRARVPPKALLVMRFQERSIMPSIGFVLGASND
jgi:hypothetical protein